MVASSHLRAGRWKQGKYNKNNNNSNNHDENNNNNNNSSNNNNNDSSNDNTNNTNKKKSCLHAHWFVPSFPPALPLASKQRRPSQSLGRGSCDTNTACWSIARNPAFQGGVLRVRTSVASPRRSGAEQLHHPLQTAQLPDDPGLNIICIIHTLGWLEPRPHASAHARDLASVHRSVPPSDRASAHPRFRTRNAPSIPPSMHPCIHASMHPSIQPSIHPSIHPSIR